MACGQIFIKIQLKNCIPDLICLSFLCFPLFVIPSPCLCIRVFKKTHNLMKKKFLKGDVDVVYQVIPIF